MGNWNAATSCLSFTMSTFITDEILPKPTVNVSQLVLFDEADSNSLDSAANTLRTSTKTIVIAIDGLRQIDVVLSKLGVEGSLSDYYFILLVCALPLQACLANTDNGPNLQSILAFNRLVLLSPVIGDFDQIDSNFTTAFSSSYNTSRFADFLSTYDACFAFCFASKLAGSPASDWASNPTSSKFVTAMQGQSFNGSYHAIQFDNWPASLVQTAFQILPSVIGDYETVYTANSVVATECNSLACFDVQLSPNTIAPNDPWTKNKNTIINECVYASQQCWTTYLPYFFGGVLFIMCISILIIYLVIKRRRRLDIYRLHWKIPRQQLKVIENKTTRHKPGTGGQAQTDAPPVVGAGAWSKRRVLREYALIGNNKAEFLALRQAKRITWDKEDLRLIHELKKTAHDNLCVFMGICYNNPDNIFYLCHALVERGSLEDYINDIEFRLDNTFRSAFLRDILKGLNYLHKSSIGYHGLLNLQTVLIDSNWVLKLTNFGIVNILNKAINRGQLKVKEMISMQTYFTCSPENLSGLIYGFQFPNGNPTGDIYAFGMILYHILFRMPPFDDLDALSALELIDSIKRQNQKPTVKEAQPEEAPLVEIMELCWQRNVSLRPRLRHLSECIANVFKSSPGNLIDQMRRLNEKHAHDLEKLVEERREQLAIVREKTEQMLHEILPKSIAMQLKEKREVQPRSYDSVTVLFCQIVDFPTVMKRYPPDQVITFLNRIFSKFDTIHRSYDAYKVETTGETYMVASGVPNENGDRNIFVISELALNFREESHKFKEWPECRSEQFSDWNLQLRIGFHCGPIAAGVIGMKAPRFCLFGDTVNFASRMQSTCPPNQIQVAESTALHLMTVGKYRLTKRGIVKVKGKGEVNTYWLNEHSQRQQHLSASSPLPGTSATPVPYNQQPQESPQRQRLESNVSTLSRSHLLLTRAESATLSLAQSLIPPSSPPNTPSNSEKSKTNTKLFSALPALQLNKGPIKKFTRNQSISAGETTPSTSEQQNGDETAIEAGRNSAAGIAALSTFSHPLELLNGANNSKRETSADDFGELKTAKLRNRRMLISSRRHSENFPIPNFMSIKPKKRGNTAAPKKL